jgi:hypothetical protein
LLVDQIRKIGQIAPLCEQAEWKQQERCQKELPEHF